MGVPVAVKDLMAVDGMPTTAGSSLDVTDIIGNEGSFVKNLKRCGCVIGTLTGRPEPKPAPFKGLRLGKPESYFYDHLDANYLHCITGVLDDLKAAGAEIVPIDVPETKEREQYFPVALPTYALAVLGRDRFLKDREHMDPIVAARCASGLDRKADEFIRVELGRYKLRKIAQQRMEGLDGWITPTMAMVAPPVADFDNLDKGMQLTLAITQATQPGSLFGQCGISSPIQTYGSDLPVGLQVLCPTPHIAEATSIGLAIEQLTGPPPVPDMTAFLH